MQFPETKGIKRVLRKQRQLPTSVSCRFHCSSLLEDKHGDKNGGLKRFEKGTELKSGGFQKVSNPFFSGIFWGFFSGHEIEK